MWVLTGFSAESEKIYGLNTRLPTKKIRKLDADAQVV